MAPISRCWSGPENLEAAAAAASRPARGPHQVSGPHPPSPDRPVQVLIEIVARLDSHPADLVPELEPLLSHGRQPAGDVGGAQDQRADALTVLTALAAARAPLTAGVAAMRRSLEHHQAGTAPAMVRHR
jgi:hypothetical protein